MPAWLALLLIAGLVLGTAVAGVVWRARTGRVRPTPPSGIPLTDLRPASEFGERATLLQFSTEFCAPCRAARRVLTEVAEREVGVAHIEVDLTQRPDLASRFSIRQTPTVLLLDGRAEVRARIGGVPRAGELAQQLALLLEGRTDARVN